jgi:pyridoxine/pyridoxamine 5'-phosphate oxidase
MAADMLAEMPWTGPPSGRVSARVVLLLAFHQRESVFCTNLNSDSPPPLTAPAQVVQCSHWDAPAE